MVPTHDTITAFAKTHTENLSLEVQVTSATTVTFTYENIRDGGGDCYELATS
jgi:hypothetical protein